MPVYRAKVRGDSKPRIIRAETAAQARNHLVELEAVKADELADLIESGAQIERAGAPAKQGESE